MTGDPVRIIEGDVLDGLAEIDDRSIDLIMTSPPYADARQKQYGGTPPDQYVDWYRPIARELLRVLKKSGSYILNIKEGLVGGERSTYVHDLVRMHREAGWRWHDTLIWYKPNGLPVGRPYLHDAWEPCWWFARSPTPWIDKQANRTPIKPHTATRRRGKPHKTILPSGFQAGINLTATTTTEVVPRNVIVIGTGTGGGSFGHPAIFPPGLPAWFIRLLCPPNGTVLDPFMGSGTTLVAADRLGRPAVGIDRSAAYCEMVAQRIADDRLKRRGKKKHG